MQQGNHGCTCAVHTCVLRAPHYAEVCKPASLQRTYVGYKARITQGKLHVKNDMSLVIVHMRKRDSDGFTANRNNVYEVQSQGVWHIRCTGTPYAAYQPLLLCHQCCNLQGIRCASLYAYKPHNHANDAHTLRYSLFPCGGERMSLSTSSSW